MARRLVGLSWLAGAATALLAGTCFSGWGYPSLINLTGLGLFSIASLFVPGLVLTRISQMNQRTGPRRIHLSYRIQHLV
jgi:hypothetical protein